jgi:hypothetical protein
MVANGYGTSSFSSSYSGFSSWSGGFVGNTDLSRHGSPTAFLYSFFYLPIPLIWLPGRHGQDDDGWSYANSTQRAISASGHYKYANNIQNETVDLYTGKEEGKEEHAEDESWIYKSFRMRTLAISQTIFLRK